MTVSGEEPVPTPNYPIGTVINGHVWTGSVWAPVVVPAAGPRQRASRPKRRGRWFRPKIVIAVWVAWILIVFILGFIPNQAVQTIVSLTWLLSVVIALPATLLALVLWLSGVGAGPVGDPNQMDTEPPSSTPA